ncbi:hypothetical protein VNO80_08136 [Phaseolus coccineus]|uniref:Uncharacterized protein n=1 Tax=Phaseolus coccineus TaxID=3886 RepID=A0AAN9NJX8_PHACN
MAGTLATSHVSLTTILRQTPLKSYQVCVVFALNWHTYSFPASMDSFKQIWGGAEGCSSSESGWTMYIASPMQEDDAGCSNENYGYHDIYGENRRKKQGAKVDEEESDDSMASDASSGPVHYHHAYGHSQTSHGTAASKKDKQDHGSKCSKKNANKQEKKRVDSRSKK